MTDEMLIREISQIKALQTVTLHLLRHLVRSGDEEFSSETRKLLADLEAAYEDRLRDDLQLEPRPALSSRAATISDLHWPEVLDSTDSDESGGD